MKISIKKWFKWAIVTLILVVAIMSFAACGKADKKVNDLSKGTVSDSTKNDDNTIKDKANTENTEQKTDSKEFNVKLSLKNMDKYSFEITEDDIKFDNWEMVI